MTMTFTARLSAPSTPLRHAWEHTVGSGHALVALRAGTVRFSFDLPPHALAAVTLEPAGGP